MQYVLFDLNQIRYTSILLYRLDWIARKMLNSIYSLFLYCAAINFSSIIIQLDALA